MLNYLGILQPPARRSRRRAARDAAPRSSQRARGRRRLEQPRQRAPALGELRRGGRRGVHAQHRARAQRRGLGQPRARLRAGAGRWTQQRGACLQCAGDRARPRRRPPTTWRCALLAQRRIEEGVATALQAMQLLPPHEQRRSSTCGMLLVAGERERAAAILRAWLAQDRATRTCSHHLAACTRRGRAGTGQRRLRREGVRQLRPHLRRQARAACSYRAPQVVAEALAAALPAPARAVRHRRPRLRHRPVRAAAAAVGAPARRLRPVGRDAGTRRAPRRLRRAAQGGAHRLPATRIRGAFDVIVSADTLDLLRRPATRSRARRRARCGRAARIVFTLEALADGRKRPLRAAGQRPLRARRRATRGACSRRPGCGWTRRSAAVLREERPRLPVQGWRRSTARRAG